MIGGRRPLQGRKPGDRRVRVERPHAPYFRYTGPGHLTAKEAASAPTTSTGRAFASIRGLLLRSAAGQRGRARRAAVQDEGAGDLQLRRHQLIRLCDRGDPARPDPGRRGRPGARRRDQHRDLDPARRRGDLVPPDLHRLPVGRRLVHGLAAEHRSNGQPDRRVGADDRLRHDRGGLDLIRCRADGLGVPGPVRRAGPDRRRGDRPHRRRQPARPARGRQYLRGADLPVHRLGADHDRRRRVSHRRPRGGRVLRPDDRRPGDRARSNRSACSWSCGRSRPVPSR